MAHVYNEIDITDIARPYFISRLSNGHALAVQLSLLVGNKGRIITFIPSDTSHERIIQFEYGGLGGPEVHHWILARIQSFLSLDDDAALLCEHSLAKPSDPWLAKTRRPMLFYRDNVYFPFWKKDFEGSDAINSMNKVVGGSPIISAITQLSVADSQELSSFIDIERIYLLAGCTKQIILGVYDCEGYLVWTE